MQSRISNIIYLIKYFTTLMKTDNNEIKYK